MTLQELIHQILINFPASRNSDKVLFDLVVNKLAPECATMPFHLAIFSDTMPSYDSVTRIRRGWQRKDPDCMSEKQVQRWRDIKEKQYREEYGYGSK